MFNVIEVLKEQIFSNLEVEDIGVKWWKVNWRISDRYYFVIFYQSPLPSFL